MQSKRKFGDNSEKRAAKKVGAKTVKGSGCLWYEKGDYETENIVFQNKATKKDHYQLKLVELEKARKDALTKNKDFIFSIQMQDCFSYCFERVLVNEKIETMLNLLPIEINKCVTIDESNNFLINDKYIVISEYSFLNIVSKNIL